MDRKVEGTFLNPGAIQDEINRLITTENYQADELLVLTDQRNSSVDSSGFNEVRAKFIDTSDVENNNSFWERLKDAFTLEDDVNDNPLEKYGISPELSGHYLEVLQDGEYLLLVDQSAPRNNIVTDIESTNKENKNNDKNKEDTQMSKDKEITEKEARIEKDQENPELTGQEESVKSETGPDTPDHANATSKTIKDPLQGRHHADRYTDPTINPEEEAAEEDMVYDDETEEAGVQSDQENK